MHPRHPRNVFLFPSGSPDFFFYFFFMPDCFMMSLVGNKVLFFYLHAGCWQKTNNEEVVVLMKS